MNITVAVIINGPKRKVWAAITDIENSANMLSGIIDVKIIEKPPQGLVGLKWLETRKIFGKAASETMWITEAVTNEYYCTRAENGGAVYTTKLSLTAAEPSTCLTMTFSDRSESIWVKMISAVIGFFLKSSMRKMLKKDLDEIKHYVESKK
ncbi:MULTISPECIES: SRPBCC family protein [unclassified Pseudoalteromonas]|jgi:hypothetical protein|uniref:SRPBCC family protein n=1 Tax=Pseudoalteromonas TaxID=53246 RepID=UPI0015CED231|nr:MULTISPECIES: SRPBCC family protein [unclassified Pseudoalteromonas]MBH0071950.1 SRPBCC family protein [Pseudoalteromonas sp. NZS127]NYR13547.1 hypothetical protein [Pseudoalteromonas sp. MIP2626]|tara:strand:- start:3403 stop:3855 length:453 start_codon:yes stop_codon:yes gene_type:complete